MRKAYTILLALVAGVALAACDYLPTYCQNDAGAWVPCCVDDAGAVVPCYQESP